MTTPSKVAPLIDELARVRDSIRVSQAREKELRDAIAECGTGEYHSAHFTANVISSEVSRIDQDAVRAYVPAAWLKKHTITTTQISVRVKPRAGSLHAAVEVAAA